MIDPVDYSEVLEDEPGWTGFQPRPDQPERYDEQEGFYNSSTRGIAWLIGGNGCLGA